MENYIAEIRIFPYNRIPDGWVPCNGQVLEIAQNQALYALLGQRFAGGDGKKTFALPNLNGRVIVGEGTNGKERYVTGNQGGAEFVQLEVKHIPPHNHTVNVNKSYDLALPATNFLGDPNVQTSSTQPQKNVGKANLYHPEKQNQAQLVPSISNSGTSVPHENRMPFLAMVYCIATKGVWPQRD